MSKNRWIIAALYLMYIILNVKFEFIELPSSDNMIMYQFSLFTIISVVAGFTFTVLTMILGFCSEEKIIKMSGTSLIKNMCKKILMSLIFFSISGIVSLAYIMGVTDELISFCGKLSCNYLTEAAANNILFSTELYMLIIGMALFMKSVKGIYDLILEVHVKKNPVVSEIINDLENEEAANQD